MTVDKLSGHVWYGVMECGSGLGNMISTLPLKTHIHIVNCHNKSLMFSICTFLMKFSCYEIIVTIWCLIAIMLGGTFIKHSSFCLLVHKPRGGVNDLVGWTDFLDWLWISVVHIIMVSDIEPWILIFHLENAYSLVEIWLIWLIWVNRFFGLIMHQGGAYNHV